MAAMLSPRHLLRTATLPALSPFELSQALRLPPLCYAVPLLLECLHQTMTKIFDRVVDTVVKQGPLKMQ